MHDVALDRPSTGYRQATKGHLDQFQVVYKFYAKDADLFKHLPSDNRDAVEEQLYSKIKSNRGFTHT